MASDGGSDQDVNLKLISTSVDLIINKIMKIIKLSVIVCIVSLIACTHDNQSDPSGFYRVKSICEVPSGRFYTFETEITLLKKTESKFLFSRSELPDKYLDAFMENDNLYIPFQWFIRYDESEGSFQGEGKIKGDSIFLHYETENTYGVVKCDCQGKKISSTE
jgi:hypothetical protein